MKNIILFAILFYAFFSGSTFAQELVYTPINPSFLGGNSFNASWLLASAQAQNTIVESRSSLDRYARDPIADFEESVKRQILSQLTRQLMTDTFGEKGLKEGHYEIGNFIIDILPVSGGISITIYDNTTGGETTIVVPYF
jgi:curli production assembly/transport component CsgF